MKKQITTFTVTFLLFTLLTLVFVLTNDVNAQQVKSAGKVIIEKYELPSNAVNSLIQGIKSGNSGLRKSAIFYAGQYKLDATVDCLIEELQKEEDPGVKILIAMSLYKIGNPIAIKYIQNIVLNETDPNLKNMFSAIYDEFVMGSSLITAKK